RLREYMVSRHYRWLDHPYIAFAMQHVELVQNSQVSDVLKSELIGDIVNWIRQRYSKVIERELAVLMAQCKRLTESRESDKLEFLTLSQYLNAGAYFSGHSDGLFAWIGNVNSGLISKNALGYSGARHGIKQSPGADLQLLSDKPLISIVMPTCNRPQLLAEAVESVANQTYRNWELIIVNEGDVDVRDVVEKYNRECNISYIRHRQSFGSSAARNSALRVASGEIVCYLDDDDIMYPHHLEIIVKSMHETGYPVVYTDAVLRYEVIENGERVKKLANPYKHDRFSKDNLCVANYLPINTWAHRWGCLEKSGLFDEDLTSLVDWDLLLRLARHYDFYHVDETTVEVRVRNEGDRITERDRHKSLDNHQIIYAKTMDMATPEIVDRRQAYLKKLEQKHTVKTVRRQPKPVDPYLVWRQKHALTEADGQILAERMRAWHESPNFLFITIIENSDTALLANTIESLNRQFYTQWTLAIIASTPATEGILDEFPNVHWLQADGDPYQAINQVLANVDAFDWVSVIPVGVVFSQKALSVIGNYINLKPAWSFIYSDEDTIGVNGQNTHPLFKPDFNFDLLRSMPYLGDCCFVKKSLIDELGGYCGLAGVLNWDLGLKVFEYLGVGAIGHVPEMLFHKFAYKISDAENQYLAAAEKLTLQRHFERLGINAGVSEGLVPHTYFIDYPLTSRPSVSIVLTVLNEDQLNRVDNCFNALVNHTKYGNYELVITSTLPEPAVKHVLNRLSFDDVELRYEAYRGESISPLSNQALTGLNGDYILLLSPELEVLHDHWLETLMAQALREDVGVVGARIVDSEKNVHHAGMILGMGDLGVADYLNRDLPMNQPGYMSRAAVVQNFSVVTTQCFLVRKQLVNDFLSAKGNVFDHVDFCLNIAQQGYFIVWTPFVSLMLKQRVMQQCSMTELRDDVNEIIEKWLPQLANDPGYNRNLSLKHRHFQIETETDVTWNVDFHDRPRVYAFPANETGIGEYRVRAPLRALSHAAMIQSSLLPNHSATLIPDIVELERVKPDVLFLQNGTADYLIHAWEQYRKFNDVFMIYSQDDLVFALPGKHPLQKVWPKDMRKRLRKLMEQSDRLIVATEPLKEAYSRWISDIRLVPNYLEKAKWLGLQFKPKKETRSKMRVGWAGGGQHHGDLEFILPVVEATKDEVDWIFMGMCPEQIRPHIHEYHGGVPFDLYPQKLADLDLDLAIAPLEYNNFNTAKTNLRVLEYGVLGWPVICSDILPYQNAPVTRVANNVNQWIKALREKINEPDALVQEGQQLKQWVVAHFMLEDHLDEWLSALKP
ncbi:MAG: glycosyltransferase, partial [Gammaproteobacteria bacterium]